MEAVSGHVYGRRRRRWPRRLAATAGVLALVAVVALGTLLVLTPSVGDAEARVAAAEAAHHVHPVSGPPARVAAALVAVEDSRYYSEPGVDPTAPGRLVLSAVLGPSYQPGATLDQQLVKLLYTGGRGDAGAKVEQFGLALKLDASYTKSQILVMYLNTVYFGHGYYGVTAAAQGYFGVAADQLSWPQAALLAGMMQAPTAYDPYSDPQLALARRAHVLSRLAATGVLTATQAHAYATTPLNLA